MHFPLFDKERLGKKYYQIPRGEIVIQGTQLVVPLPAAVIQFLLGLMAVIAPAIQRKTISI